MAYAQECADITHNAEWNQLMKEMATQIEQEDYETARKTGDKLIKICPTMPSVNYLIGKIYQEQGDNRTAHSYFRVATDNTELFTVNKDFMKKMWYALYESENPEVLSLKSGKLKDEYVDLLETEKLKYKELEQSIENHFSHEVEYAKSIMWTGVGVLIGGAVLTGVGGLIWGLGGTVEDVSLTKYDFQAETPNENSDLIYQFDVDKIKNMNSYTTGTVLFGVGLGVSVVGAIITGISGYKYTQLKTKQETKDELDVSFNISYNRLMLNMTF